MKHLQINPQCSILHDISWVLKNFEKCRIKRNDSKDSYTYSSISVKGIDGNLWSEYSLNIEGWFNMNDWDASHLPEVLTLDGIREVEEYNEMLIRKFC